MYHKGRTNGEFFDNYKAQCWWALRERFRQTFVAVTTGEIDDPDGLISINPKIPLLSKLSAELSQPTYRKTIRGKVIVDKAPEGMKSPNLADMVMMAYAQQSTERQPKSRVFKRKQVA